MIQTRSRLILLTAVLAVAAIGLVVAVLVLPPRQSADVAVPANDARPEQVVSAYLESLNAHDCDTAGALWVPEASDAAQPWCESVMAITQISIDAASDQDPAWSGDDATTEVVYVPVEFDLAWRPLRGDGSMPEGDTTWGFRLILESPSGPWRIADQGVG